MIVGISNPRNIRHEEHIDYYIHLNTLLGYDSERMPFTFKGPDIKIGDIWDEGKSWDEERPSYASPRFWKGLIYNKILIKFSDGRVGTISIPLEIPVKWRDFLRDRNVFPVYVDPKKGIDHHLRVKRMALLQAEDRYSSLHSDGIGYRKDEFNIEINTILDLLSDIKPPFEVKFEDQIIKGQEEYYFSLI